MKTIYIKSAAIIALILGITTANAQKDNVGIGTSKPDHSALLDLSSQSKGLLIPRMSLEQRGSILSPANGLMIYQTDFLSGFYYFDGKEWKPMMTSTNANSVADANNWGLTGNTGLTAGTNFIGANIPLEFKHNGARVGLLSTADNLFMGYLAGNVNAANLNVAVGYQALKVNTTGSNNTAFGSNALAANVGGGSNVALGASSLISNVSGNFNIGIGYQALNLATSSSGNVGIGYSALEKASGGYNVAIGYAALNATGSLSGNVGIGYLAGLSTTGNNGIFIGNQAGSNETTGEKLYIANSGTSTPLIYGDFSAKYLAVGEVTAADRAANTSGGYRLLVKGGMITEKIKVATAGTADWADYVFDTDYKVMPLEEVEAFVKENKHLPNVPTTQEVMENGNDLGKTDAKLLEKIEELTLYMIEMNKEIKALKKENEQLKKK